jgi:hypothetical protein
MKVNYQKFFDNARKETLKHAVTGTRSQHENAEGEEGEEEGSDRNRAGGDQSDSDGSDSDGSDSDGSDSDGSDSDGSGSGGSVDSGGRVERLGDSNLPLQRDELELGTKRPLADPATATSKLQKTSPP